jgi:hypothetical protein
LSVIKEEITHGVCKVKRKSKRPNGRKENPVKEVRRRMEAYCVKCKAKREMKNAQKTTMKNNKPATTGICPVCGTKMFKIGA